MKPRIAIALGDPAGIGPELIAKLLADPSARYEAEIVVIADRREMEEGMRVAASRFAYAAIHSLEDLIFNETPLLYDFRGAATEPFVRQHSSAAGGRYSMDTLKIALDLTTSGKTDAMMFGPLNKSSLHLAGMACKDDLHWFAEQLGASGPMCEFNVIDGF